MTTTPVVDARRLSLWLGSGWAYRGVDLVVLRGELVVLLGRDGGWRTPLLRTLALQLEPTEGALSVCGYVLPEEVEVARRKISVARMPGAVAANPSLRVNECLHAQHMMADLPPDTEVFAAAADLIGLAADPDAAVGDLDAFEQRLLAVALALTAPVELLLLDDADHGLGDADRKRLWRALNVVSRTGTAVVAGSASEPVEADQVVTLPEESSKFIT